MKKTSGLGLGLSSLIPKNTTHKEASVYNVELHKIRPNPKQPRKTFNESAIQELASSIKKFGVLQPILVTKVPKDTASGIDFEYEVVAGERRLRAAKLLELPSIPVIIKDEADEEKTKLEMALIENLQREDLNVLEEADAYASLTRDFGLTHQELADRLGKSREVVSNAIRLMELPSEMRHAVLAGQMSRSQARSLLAFKDDPRKMKLVFQQILKGGLATIDMEQMAKDHKESKKTGGEVAKNMLKFDDFQKRLSEALGTAVVIRSGASGGSISIKFSDTEKLKAIIDLISA